MDAYAPTHLRWLSWEQKAVHCELNPFKIFCLYFHVNCFHILIYRVLQLGQVNDCGVRA